MFSTETQKVRRKVDIAPKKQAKQQRSIATVAAIVEAAIYILRTNGAGGFTANKVAEKAGVNVASFYQYFPNKEALLFHIAKLTWEAQLARLSPILMEAGRSHANRLRDFLREFFLVEATEADLRQALRVATVELRSTDEFQAVLHEGAKLTRQFFKEAVGGQEGADLEFMVHFIVLLTTSFAERTTDEHVSTTVLIRQADVLADMLVNYFGIA